MAEDKESILADFQACTGIEDIGECILILDQTNWSLLDAINQYMPKETQTLPSEQGEVELSRLMARSASPPPLLSSTTLLGQNKSTQHASIASTSRGFTNNRVTTTSKPPARFPPPVTANRDLVNIVDSDSSSESESEPARNKMKTANSRSSSNSYSRRARRVHLNVVYRDQDIPVVISENETVADVKTILHGQLGIPPCMQHLEGWPKPVLSDRTKLSSLPIGRHVALTLVTPDVPTNNGPTSSDSEKLSAMYKLHIVDGTNNKAYDVNYNGRKCVAEVKQDVFNLTDIPVRHQIWSGWPRGQNSDTTLLGEMSLDRPSHQLRVIKRVVDRANERVIVNLASDSEPEEFEDAIDTFNAEEEMGFCTKRSVSLIPAHVDDELAAVNHFISEFTDRYGHCRPMFLEGTLDDALKEACQKPAKDRKLLAVYLHHDQSVLSNVFCQQLLCAESVVSFLTNNFITWGWDMTHGINRERFLATVTQHFGPMAAATVRGFPVEQLPVLLIIVRLRSTTEVFTVIHGNITLDELMTRLINAVDMFVSQQQLDISEEREREEREAVKREQDAAYLASLEADKAKEEARRLHEAAELKSAQEAEEQRQNEEALKEAIRQSLQLTVPAEPPESCLEAVTRLRIRLPSGQALTRRFYASNTLQSLLDWLTVEGFSAEEYKVLSSWPRRDLTALDRNATLKDLSLFPQETLTLEER